MKISVIIPSYNQKEYLIEAVDSVLGQTLKPYQVIIVDDASQDGSQEVIAGYQARYPDLIFPVFHSINQGVAVTRNDALSVVTGDYVTSLDGDDRYLPEKLESEAKKFSSANKVQLVFSNYYVINALGDRIDLWADHAPPEGEVFCQVFGRAFPKGRLFRDELIYYPAWKNIGFFDPNLRVYEDYDMRIRLSHQLLTAYTNQVLMEHRRLPTGLSKLKTQIYLDSFDYIWQKNKPLLANISPIEQERIGRRLNHWRALLIRRLGREALRGTPKYSPSRIRALRSYQESLRYHIYLDIPFILEWILSPKGYQISKDLYYRFKRLQLTRLSS